MKLLHKRYLKTIGVTWGISLLLFAVAFVLFLGPQGSMRKSTLRELMESEQTYDAAREAARQESKERLERELARLRGQVGDFVVPFENSADLTFDIGRMARELDIESFNVTNQPAHKDGFSQKSEYVVEQGIEVTGSATFSQFASLLNALERHRPALFVQQFEISPPNEAGARPKIRLNLVCLVRKPDKE